MGSRFASAAETRPIFTQPIQSQGLSLSAPQAKLASPELEINTYQAHISHQFSDCVQRLSSVTGELLRQVQVIRCSVSIEELECELFSLCRDHQEVLQEIPLSLESVEFVHHLSKLQEIAGDLSPLETEELWSDIQKVVEMRPLAVVEYKWTDRMLSFLSRLMVKWELVNVNLYKYRNNVSAPIGKVQEMEFSRRQSSIVTMDTLWFACACTHPPMSLLIPQSLHKLATALHTRMVDAIRFAVDLNSNVNFLLHPGIEEAIGLTCEPCASQVFARSSTKDSPEKFTSHMKRPSFFVSPRKLRLKSAKRIKFHLLDLPSVPCKCFENEHQRKNVVLKQHLSHLEQLYRVFEMEFLEAAEAMKAREGLNVAYDTSQSHPASAADSLVNTPEHWMS